MKYVRSNRDREVATYCPRLGGQRIYCSNKLPKSLDNVGPLKNHQNNGTRGHVVHQLLKERLPLVDAVERFCLLVRDLMQFQLFECEPFLVQSASDLAHKAVLDGVSLEDCA